MPGVKRLSLVFFGHFVVRGAGDAHCSHAFLGRGRLRIRGRRFGGSAVGGGGASRLYRGGHGDKWMLHLLSSLSTLLCASFFVRGFSL